MISSCWWLWVNDFWILRVEMHEVPSPKLLERCVPCDEPRSQVLCVSHLPCQFISISLGDTDFVQFLISSQLLTYDWSLNLRAPATGRLEAIISFSQVQTLCIIAFYDMQGIDELYRSHLSSHTSLPLRFIKGILHYGFRRLVVLVFFSLSLFFVFLLDKNLL